MRKQFSTLCGRAGIGTHWTTAGAAALVRERAQQRRVDIEEIADAVGHINSTVTKAVYRHQIADEITSAATAMDALFGDASGT